MVYVTQIWARQLIFLSSFRYWRNVIKAKSCLGEVACKDANPSYGSLKIDCWMILLVIVASKHDTVIKEIRRAGAKGGQETFIKFCKCKPGQEVGEM